MMESSEQHSDNDLLISRRGELNTSRSSNSRERFMGLHQARHLQPEQLVTQRALESFLLPFSSATVKGEREATVFSPFSAGEAVGSFPLRLPLRRRREGGGTPVLRSGAVDRVGSWVSGGGVWMAAASLHRINGPRSQLHLGGAVRGEVEGPVGDVFCWSWCPADLVVLCSFGAWDLGFPGSVGTAAVSAARVGVLFLRCRLPLSGVCSAAGGRPDGSVQVIFVGGGLRRRVLGLAAGIRMACWWMIWCFWVADGGRCWVRWGVWPCHARSSVKIPSIAAGGFRLQLWRPSLPLVRWWFASFFAGVRVGVKVVWQTSGLLCSVPLHLASLSFADVGMYGLRLLLCLYPLLC